MERTGRIPLTKLRIGRRDQQDTARTKNRQELHEHIPPKSFSLQKFNPTGRTIGQGVLSQEAFQHLEQVNSFGTLRVISIRMARSVIRPLRTNSRSHLFNTLDIFL